MPATRGSSGVMRSYPPSPIRIRKVAHRARDRKYNHASRLPFPLPVGGFTAVCSNSSLTIAQYSFPTSAVYTSTVYSVNLYRTLKSPAGYHARLKWPCCELICVHIPHCINHFLYCVSERLGYIKYVFKLFPVDAALYLCMDGQHLDDRAVCSLP